MIGTTLKRKRDRALFRVIGRDGGQWIIGPDEFGPAVRTSELEIAELFAVVSESDAPTAAPEPSVRVLGMSDAEAAGRERLRAQMEQQAASRARSPQGPTPEEVFADAAGRERE